ncbi:uncharacterized protein A1O5_13224 [Cladophialophora psammophila CBS 110553]|uniref:NAD(P)-binding protein n=1 Tax=Cladophialophora psammophila CBS 110553 TaxID=1182543 RepID=W9VDL2_9EURO|nr:uncharacterized protein A1O5_13224 [Cladophialophora psammophila CBS 110553]EXJ53553.1 hypothetical protein A1O5_13224 [Cladophialophora psammophila CBS 110553]
MSKFPSFTKTWHHSPYATIDPLEPSLSAHGKIVFITGGATGIGKATAIAFAQAKARAVVITGRTRSTLDSAKVEIESAAKARNNVDFQCLIFRADVTSTKAMDDAFSQTVQKLGRIDVLVSNAGYLDRHSLITESELDDYWQCFETNVKGALVVINAFLKTCPRAQGQSTGPSEPTVSKPVIINISTGAAHLPPSMLTTFSAYATSKLAALHIFCYLQAENPDSLIVFNLQPGEIPTAMARKGQRDMAKDDVRLPASWCVWAVAKAETEANFLKGRFVWGNWDVDELSERREEVVRGDLLKVELKGWGGEFVERYVE